MRRWILKLIRGMRETSFKPILWPLWTIKITYRKAEGSHILNGTDTLDT